MCSIRRIIIPAVLLLGLSQLSCNDNPADVPVESDGACSGGTFSLSKPKADWTWQKSDTSATLMAAAGNGTFYVVAGRKMVTGHCTDVVNWETYSCGGHENYYAALALGEKIILVGTKGVAVALSYGEYGLVESRCNVGHQNDLYALSKSSVMILGVGANGEMVKSFDGVVWQRLAPFTSADLWAATDEAIWTIVAGDSGTVLSTTEGIYWNNWNTGLNHNFRGVAVNDGGRFVFVTAGGLILTTSWEHKEWVVHDIAGGRALRDVEWTGKQFVAVGDRGFIAVSRDGSCWSVFETGFSADLLDVTSGPKLLIVGTQGTILTSDDAFSWQWQRFASWEVLYDVLWAGGHLVAVGWEGTVCTSRDGVSWSKKMLDGMVGGWLYSICDADGQYWISGTRGALFTSSNAVDWRRVSTGVSEDLWGCHWTGSELIVSADGGTLLKTEDGVAFHSTPFPDRRVVSSFAQSPDVLIAVTGDGGVFISHDGVDWTVNLDAPWNTQDVIWSEGVFVAVSRTYGAVYTSLNGLDWKEEGIGAERCCLSSVARSGTATVVIGTSGRVYSKDGDGPWRREDSGTNVMLNAVTEFDGGFVAVGDWGTILTRNAH